MSELYKDADKVTRGFYVGEDYTEFIVQDEMDLNRNSEVYWFMHTKADIELIDDKTALLSQNGKSIFLQVVTDAAEWSLGSMDAVPLDTSPAADGQNTNPGVRKIAIRLKGSGKINLMVRMSPVIKEDLQMQPISEWRVPGGVHSAQKDDYGYSLYVDGVLMENASEIPVIDENRIPSYEIVLNDPSKSYVIDSDDARLNGKVKLTIYNADKSGYTQARIIYTNSSSAMFSFYYCYRAQGITVTDEPEPENPGINAIDGDEETRWTCKVLGGYGIFDYGKIVNFDSIAVAFWKGNERHYNFDLEVSDDGINFKPIGSYSTNGKSSQYEIIALDASASGRYLKFINQGNTTNDVSNVTELMLLNKIEK
jgi:hypothetical protein